ncbi:cytosolic phospholipase A2 gamma-like [Hyperolius riggenbachi]|uniref:cytosolic phospholipase A2 gamma-like n=1 Tax=Hyperolius riggenbachi TaxID=752182 RepID=UPI0035A390CE
MGLEEAPETFSAHIHHFSMDGGETKDCIVSSSEGEEASIKARKNNVTQTLMKQGYNVKVNVGPPVIAVLGSGGGSRAMTAFLGTLSKLAELKLLDLVTYIGGTSGSTWCMSSLYTTENWTNVEVMKNKEEQLFKKPFSLATSWKKTKAAFLQAEYSLTDLWAFAVVYYMTKEMIEEKLSGLKNTCGNGSIPYPVFSAVEKYTGTWCEFNPHLCGFPIYKSFVDTELLGSKFEAGTLSAKQPEWELCYLRGLWGSAPASEEAVREALIDLLKKLVPWKFQKHKETSLLEEATEEVSEDVEEAVFCKCKGCELIRQIILDDSPETTFEQKLYKWKETMEKDAPHSESSEMETIELNILSDFCDDVKVLWRIVTCLSKWLWGLTNDFLYKYKEDLCPKLVNEQEMCLVDAGLFINIPYPLMLHPYRKVDLILSFDFSSGDPFLTLKLAAKYCKEHQIPFPNVDTKATSEDIPSQCCYIFEGDGKGAPTVMHFPLFNNQTCEGKVNELRDEYSTFKLNYSESEVTKLLEVAKKNVEESYEKIKEYCNRSVEWSNKMGAETEEAAASGVN